MMVQTVILARHGNTIEHSTKPVWIGSSDPPLTQIGRAQAEVLACEISKLVSKPMRITTGPFKRHFEYAKLVRERLGVPESILTDERLGDVSFGKWEGTSSSEFPPSEQTELENWRANGAWPASAAWEPGPEVLEARVNSLVRDWTADTEVKSIICIASYVTLCFFFWRFNGVRSCSSSPPRVSTGNYSVVSMSKSGASVLAWNNEPLADGNDTFTRLR